MKFTSVIVLGLVSTVYATSSASETAAASGSTLTTAPAVSQTPTAESRCLAACDPKNVTCRANCLGVPAPNSSMIGDTQACASACPQGSGSPQNALDYGKCLSSCITQHFQPATGAPNAAGAGSGGATATGTGAQATATGASSPSGSSGSGSNSGSSPSGSSGTKTGAAASSSPSGSAGNKVTISFAGILGAIAAVLAL